MTELANRATPDFAVSRYRPDRVARRLRQMGAPAPAPWFVVRPETSDWKAIREVWERNAYLKQGIAPHRSETWLDAGANVGAFARLVAELGATAIAVEADGTNAGLTALNTPRGRVQVLAGAVVEPGFVGDRVGLNVNTAPMALRRHSIMRARRESSVVSVEALRIDELVRCYSIDGVKLNIEGAEIPILTTWTPPASVRALVAEWSFDVDARLATLREALDRLEARYQHVTLSRKIDWTLETFPWYPPQVYIYAHD